MLKRDLFALAKFLVLLFSVLVLRRLLIGFTVFERLVEQLTSAWCCYDSDISHFDRF